MREAVPHHGLASSSAVWLPVLLQSSSDVALVTGYCNLKSSITNYDSTTGSSPPKNTLEYFISLLFVGYKWYKYFISSLSSL